MGPSRLSSGPAVRVLSRLLLLFVTALSFGAVWTVSSLLTVVVPSVALVLTGGRSFGMPQHPTGWGALWLGCVVAFYASVPLTRFVSRVFPVRINGNRRYGLIVACVAGGAFWVFTAIYLRAAYFVMVVPMTVLVLSTVAWSLVWQLRTTRSLDVPFILFLRRFSAFSDRSVLAALLVSRPAGYRTAFLAAPSETAAGLSPLVVAFSGTRWWRPLASCPLPLSARDVEWEDNVEDLVRAAGCIVIDPSERSPAIDREVAIVGHVASPDRVVWLADEGGPAPQTTPGEERHLVRYRRSWRAALPRITFETIVVCLVAASVAGSAAQVPELQFLPPWVYWALGLALVALAGPVILRPAVDRQGRRRMQAVLSEILANPRKPVRDSGLGRSQAAGCATCAVVSAPAHADSLAALAASCGLVPVVVGPLVGPRALRDAIRLLKRAAVVLADLSMPDRDTDYLLGIGHGLGRKVVLASCGTTAPLRGMPVHAFTPGSTSGSVGLAGAIESALRDPLSQGPVARLLADDWVFGDPLNARRLAAFAADAVLSCGMVLAYVAWNGDSPSAAGFEVGIFSSTLMVLALYRGLCLALTASTPGLALAGLRLIDADGGRLSLGQALGRPFATYVTLMPFAASLAALFGPRHQILEDLLSGTRLVRRKPRALERIR